MREIVDRQRLERFMTALARAVTQPAQIYFVGGASAVWHGWRSSTLDVDLNAVPDSDEIYRAIVRLKDELSINVEPVAPGGFIPELPGWKTRSAFIETIGPLSFYHFDFYSQALSKLERGHERDLLDVAAMHEAGMIQAPQLWELFLEIKEQLFRYPAIDPPSFRCAVHRFVFGAPP
jgi:hypothetical protein